MKLNGQTEKHTAEELIAIESMTKKTIASINEKKLLLKIKREMYKNRFDNDDAWREADKVYREAKLKRTQEKLRILEEAEMKALDAEIDTTAREVKDEQLSLSDWLYTYQNQTGASIVELDNGQTMLIQRKYSVKKESKAARWLRTHKPDVLAKYPGYQTSMSIETPGTV